MRISIDFRLLLLTVLLAVVLIPSSGWANTSKNCPTEPAQGVAIVSGETYFGTNCVLNTAADQDTFVFKANAGDTWSMVDALTTGGFPNDICLTLNDPGGNKVVPTACSNTRFGTVAAVITTQLAVGGTYTILVTETMTQPADYGLSLERVSPVPTDATVLLLGTPINGGVDTPTAQDPFSVYAATSGKYEIIATMTSGGFPQNLCFTVYQPGGSAFLSAQCTNTRFGTTTVSATFTPPVTGTFLVIVYSQDQSTTLNYTLSTSCLSAPGTCPGIPPKCSFSDKLNYNSTTGVLTMNFTLFTPVAVTWRGFLVSSSGSPSMWSQAQAATPSAITVSKTQSLGKSGVIGVLSTLSTTPAGITCSNWTSIGTGKP